MYIFMQFTMLLYMSDCTQSKCCCALVLCTLKSIAQNHKALCTQHMTDSDKCCTPTKLFPHFFRWQITALQACLAWIPRNPLMTSASWQTSSRLSIMMPTGSTSLRWPSWRCPAVGERGLFSPTLDNSFRLPAQRTKGWVDSHKYTVVFLSPHHWWQK